MNLNILSSLAFTKDLHLSQCYLFVTLVTFQVIHPKLYEIINLEILNSKSAI